MIIHCQTMVHLQKYQFNLASSTFRGCFLNKPRGIFANRGTIMLSFDVCLKKNPNLLIYFVKKNKNKTSSQKGLGKKMFLFSLARMSSFYCAEFLRCFHPLCKTICMILKSAPCNIPAQFQWNYFGLMQYGWVANTKLIAEGDEWIKNVFEQEASYPSQLLGTEKH